MSHVTQHSIRRTIGTFLVFGAILTAAFLSGVFDGTGSSAQNANNVVAKLIEPEPELWHEAATEPSSVSELRGPTVPRKYRAYHLDAPAMDAVIKNLGTSAAKATLDIPMPDGSLANFRVTDAPVVEKGLADKYPFLQTFRGQGVDDPSTTLRFDFMNGTFRAIVLSPRGIVLVDPHPDASKEVYMSYFLADSSPTDATSFCPTGIDHQRILKDVLPEKPIGRQVFAGDVQRTYVIAIGTTAQWTDLMGGGTLAGGLARVVSILNRIDLIYERDLAIHLVLAANNDRIIFVGGSPYNNNDLQQMMTQNKNILRTRLSGYDLGHAFGTKITGNIAGIALGVGLTCGSERESAASKITADSGFDLLTPVHEIGHQMGADHTFNTADRSPQSAFEPSSGFSIMSHGGDSIFESFHVGSVEQILQYTQEGTGRVCGTDSPTGNTIPSALALSGFNIPKQTPFSLTAAASDADGDTLTYAWQEFDLGATAPPDTDADGQERPIFRAFDPVSEPTRFFPSLQFIRNNANVPPPLTTCNGFTCNTLESLPNITRTMQFQVLVRDNRSGTGAVNSAFSVVNVDGGSGPFVLTSPNTGTDTQTGTPLTVTWDVANTTAQPVNAATVDIRLSIDGGQTFPITLTDATPNDGVESVALPNVTSRRARIMVIGHDNIFFDMSDANFAINNCPPDKCGPLEITPTASFIARGDSVAFGSSGGTGGHNFSIVENSSNGTIDPASGFFTAGPGVGTDVIRVTDAVGTTADASVTTLAECIAGERTWDGGGPTLNWSDAGNWTCDIAPQNGNNIVFDTTSTKDIVIDIPISVNSFRINAGFTGSVTLASAAFSSIDFSQSDGAFNAGASSVSLGGAFTQSGGIFNGGSGPMSVRGAFSLSGGAFTATSNSTSFASNFQHRGGIFEPNGGTVIFVGSAASRINEGLPAVVETFNNLTFQRTGIVNLKVSGIINVLGDLNLNSGQVQQDVLVSVLNANGDVSVGSDFNGLITLNQVGSGDQTITITGSPLTPWSSWIVNKPSGKVRLASNLQWPGGLQSFLFANGQIDTGNFVLDLGEAVGSPGNGYVIGNLRKTFFGSTIFEVGTDSGFSPVGISQEFGSKTFTVRSNDGILAGLDPTNSLRRNWTITTSGVPAADLVLNYADADVPVGANEQNFKFIRQNGTLNEVLEPTTIDAVSNTFTLSNVTEFSTWTLGQLAPTAAAVEIMGRVFTPVGSGISRARITLTDQNGDARTAVTNPFGYYIISGVESGRSYVLSVKAKGYSFASSGRVITVDDYISGLDFIAEN